MIYTVTFNPSLDYTLSLEKLELGRVNRAAGETLSAGGKGLNVSMVLQNLGYPSTALGFVSGFTGDESERRLKARRCATRFIHLPAGLSRINVKVRAEEESEINGLGPPIGPEALEGLYAILDELEEGDILVLAGSIPAALPDDIYQNILKRLQGRGIPAVVDATGDLLCETLSYRPFLIKPNNHELGEIFGRPLAGAEEIASCAEQLRRRGAQNVLVSMAGDGAILVSEGGARFRAAAPQGRVKGSVGAGDSMVAGFLAGWLASGGDVRRAFALAVGAGSATAFSETLATGVEAERLASQVRIESF